MVGIKQSFLQMPRTYGKVYHFHIGLEMDYLVTDEALEQRWWEEQAEEAKIDRKIAAAIEGNFWDELAEEAEIDRKIAAAIEGNCWDELAEKAEIA